MCQSLKFARKLNARIFVGVKTTCSDVSLERGTSMAPIFLCKVWPTAHSWIGGLLIDVLNSLKKKEQIARVMNSPKRFPWVSMFEHTNLRHFAGRRCTILIRRTARTLAILSVPRQENSSFPIGRRRERCVGQNSDSHWTPPRTMHLLVQCMMRCILRTPISLQKM